MKPEQPDNIGHQLSSDELHARQQQQSVGFPGPVVVAAGLTDPINIGSLFRLADAVACREIVFVDTTIHKPGKVKAVSRNTQAYVQHRFLSSDEFLAGLADFPRLIALEITTKSSEVYTTELPQEMALVVGSERHGIPVPLLERCERAVHLPMLGINSSMNVTLAAGLALYEWHRRFRV
jgi:tRNA G18 (ribose-2'-O)-methylase SpoU